MAETQGRIPFVAYDADGRIDQDLPCLKCGYNLRTMRDDGQCPECGASVRESARLAWLCQHDAVWLRRLARATIWIEVAMVCVVAWLVLVLWQLVGGPVPGNTPEFSIAFLAIGAVAGLIGFWRITTPHRGGSISRVRVRRVARGAMAVGLAGFLGFVAFATGELGIPTWVGPPLGVSAVLCLMVGACATLTYAAALAAKVPAPRLVRQVRIVTWGFALCFVGAFMVGAVRLLLAAKVVSGGSLGSAFAVTAYVPTIGMLIPCIWTIPLLVWYRRRFMEAVAMAEQGAGASDR